MTSPESPSDSRTLVFLALGLALLGWQVMRDMPNGSRNHIPAAQSGVFFWTKFEDGLSGLCRRHFSDSEKGLAAGVIHVGVQTDNSPSYNKPDIVIGALPPQGGLLFFRPLPVNDVDEELLATVHGIGPALAARVIEYRRRVGPIKSGKDLLSIQGIGPKKLEKLAPQLTFE